jgi:protein-disulfide isomerase
VLEKNPKQVKLVMKHFPLPNHSFARKAAIAAAAAEKQGKFWEIHEKLFANQRQLGDAKVEEIARELGLNMERFDRDLKDPEVQGRIDRDLKNGQQANVRGTPTIFLNGKVFQQRSLPGFQQAIDAEMKIVSSNLCEIFEVGKIGANLPNWI